MQYKLIKPREMLKVDSFANACQRFLDKNYVFEGESHDFWEFQYISKGETFIHSINDFYRLRPGEMTFFRPNQFHVVYGNGVSPSEMWVFSFRCDSPLLDKLAHSIINAPPDCVNLMKRILEETRASFIIHPEPKDGRILRRKPPGTPGSEQVIANRLEELLILLLRCKEQASPTERNLEVLRVSQRESLAENIQAYLENHVHASLTLNVVAQAFSVSVSHVKASYKAAFGVSPIAAFHTLKISRAKELLAQRNLSVSEIAATLSFENVYHFSNFFKTHTQLSPTAYRRQIHSQQK